VTASLALLLLATLASLLLALLVGSVSVSPLTVMHALTGGDGSPAAAVVLELRLPRALTAFVTGALLGLAGALMQVLLRNPLADPYVLGVSGGAAVAALLVLITGAPAFWLGPAAFGGALAAMLVVFGLARGPGGWTPERLLLTGIVLAAGWSAAITFLLAVSPERSLRSMLFWLMGDLSNPPPAGWAWLVLALGLALGLALARPLNLLARGELQARLLGVAVTPLRLTLFLIASLLTATAVTLAGSVGFVGLVVPHLLRLAVGSDHRIVIPGAALAGGCLLVLADTAARTVIAPQQLPVGVLLAVLGVPLFLLLLRHGFRRTVAG
jgi:iron complex transport system permease protein